MIDSTNPRVLADNVRHLASDISALQTTVTALGSYLTTEVDTGKIWIDGSKIYRIVLSFGEAIEISYNGYSSLSTDIPIALLLEGKGIYEATKMVFSVFGYNDAGTLKLQTERNGFPIQINKLILEYTKSAPSSLASPAPDDTRSIEPEVRDPEAEPIEEPVVEVKKTTRKKTTTTE